MHWGQTPKMQCWPVCKRRCTGRRRVLHHRHMCKQNQGRVLMHAWQRPRLDLLGADNPDAEGTSRDCQAAMSRAARGRTSGFLFEVRGARPRTHRVTEENCRGSSATLDQVRSVGRRVRLRAEARACPAIPASHTEPSIETTELRDLR